MTVKIQTSGSRMRTKRHQVEGTRHCACAWAVIVAAVWVGSMMVPPALAEEGKRVAFVVGIGKYKNLSTDKQLKNAVNDANGVSEKLSQIGFQVTKGLNLSRSDFNTKWQDVLNSLRKEDTFVLFFSGHGVLTDKIICWPGTFPSSSMVGRLN